MQLETFLLSHVLMRHAARARERWTVVDQAQHIIARGAQLHRAGQLGAAEAAYRQALTLAPDHADALHLLGVLAYQVGRHELSESLIRRALVGRPASADVHNNLGNALWGLGRGDDAVAAYRRALRLSPRYADAHANLGNVLLARGQRSDAERHYRAALEAAPSRVDVLTNLGATLGRDGRAPEGLALIERAVRLAPDSADAHHARSRVLHELGRIDEAQASARRALALRPDFAHAHAALGNALLAGKAIDEAGAAYQRALSLGLRDSGVLINLGALHLLRGRVEAARACSRQALALAPDSLEALNNLGHILTRTGQLGPAIELLERALVRDPAHVGAINNLGNALAAQGRVEEAIACHRRAVDLDPDDPNVHSILVFQLELDPRATRSSIFAERRRWNDRHARPLGASVPPHANDRDPDRRLRVGYVSGDFSAHSAAAAFAGVVLHHDPRRVEVVCYADGGREDGDTERFRRAAALWRPIVGMSDAALAERVREDAVDILVDLTGHAGVTRLLTFARKPAPVQVTAWGYAVGTGLDTIDYFFGDPVSVPPEARAEFSEAIVDLPCLTSFMPPRDAPDVAPLPARARDGVTFGCFNRLAKVTAALPLWATILHRVPDARLLLKFIGLEDESTRRRLLQTFADHGVGPERLALLGTTDRRGHLAAYHEVDIALDPFPHGGGITALEGLWMGVPMVCLLGDRVAGRLGASILTTLDLPELIAETPEEYVEIAVRQARDLERLAGLRAGLRERLTSSILGDHRAYCDVVEAAYRGMWRRWCAGGSARA